MSVFLVIVVILLVAGFEFLLCAGLLWLACWAFAWTFSWKVAVGVWAIMSLVSIAVKPSSGGTNDG